MQGQLFPIFVRSGKRTKQFQAGFIDVMGNVVVKPVYECAGVFREGLGPIQVSKRWGLIDSSGKIVIEPISGGEAFSEGRAVFSSGNEARCGVMDRTGRVIVAPTYFRMGNYSEGMVWMSNVGAWRSEPGWYRTLDADGNVRLPFFFDDARGFREGVAPVKLGGKWGFISPSGSFAIPNKFDFAAVFSEGLARIRLATSGGISITQASTPSNPSFARRGTLAKDWHRRSKTLSGALLTGTEIFVSSHLSQGRPLFWGIG